jgi:hypothetical protein
VTATKPATPTAGSKITTAVADEFIVRGKRIPVKICHLEHERLRFYPENPRIFSIIGAGEKLPSQDEIQRRLLGMEHVRVLIQDIKRNDGLIDPVIVKDGSLEVLEGNSRLAAFRALSDIDPIKWGYIKCVLLPADLSDEAVFSLLGQYHVKGKKDWAPFEQAGFLYRRHRNQGVDISSLSKEIGIGRGTVRQLVDAYQFMIDHHQSEVSRWSYFYEYLKSKKIKKARDSCEGFDKLIVKKIESGEIGKATDVRDKLPILASASDGVFKKFAKGELDFEEAYERAVHAGGDNASLRKLSGFRKWLGRSEVQKEILELDGEAGKRARYEFQRLASLSRSIKDKLEPDS